MTRRSVGRWAFSEEASIPLVPGHSREVISRNISEMVHAGHPQRQAVAASLRMADQSRAAGGLVPATPPWVRAEAQGMSARAPRMSSFSETHRPNAVPIHRPPSILHGLGGMPKGASLHPTKLDIGGVPMSSADPWWTRAEARGMDYHPGGLINSDVAGRTDRLPLAVAAESHVIPADVVSGMGQGSTQNGAKALDAALHVGPFGTPLIPVHHGSSLPHASAMHIHQATGGRANGHAEILAAGGEYIVPPHAVLMLGMRAMPMAERRRLMPKGNVVDAQSLDRIKRAAFKKGHEVLDDMIHRVRRYTIEFLKHAPPPVK